MTSFVDVFGGAPVQPSNLMYQLLTLSSVNDGVTLVWPGLDVPGSSLVARVLDLTSDVGGRTCKMPPANEVSTGQDALLINRGAFQIIVNKNDGSSLVTLNAGDAKYIYLTDQSTAAGVWGIVAIGATVSFADATALAGSGLLPYLGKLVWAMPNQEIDSSFTPVIADRCKIFTFTGGSQTLTLPSAGTMGAQFLFGIRNNGTGTITVNRSGTDTIDGQLTIQMNPDESSLFFSTGTKWYTIGRGRSTVFSFTQLVKSVAGSSNVTLTSAEIANKLITLTGLLTGNISVIFPNVVNVYYLFNNTTGSFTLTVRTAAGTGFAIPQGQRVIVFCDGTDIFAAQTAVPGSAVLFADGTQANPSIAFASDVDVGLYRFGSNEGAAVANNVIVFRWNPTSLLLGQPLAFTAPAVRDATVAALGISSNDQLNQMLPFLGGL